MKGVIFFSFFDSFDRTVAKGWFPYDRRRSRIPESSAIVCDHMETHLCDRDRRRSQKIEPCSIFCDRLRSCDHMETKVLRAAIEMYPIIFLLLTDDSTLRSHKARIFVSSNAHLL